MESFFAPPTRAHSEKRGHMSTRPRRAGGGLQASLAGLSNPTPTSMELPDDDFDPTGGAFRDEDRSDDEFSDSDGSDGNDSDEGVLRPTKSDGGASGGKGKLRMRAGIALDDGEYVGKSSSRKEMEGAWAGEEEEDDDDDVDMSDDEGIESEVDDDEDDDDADDFEYPMSAGAANDALEAELAAVRVEETEANRLLAMKSQNQSKGIAVRVQNQSWERSLRTRIVLQKSLNLAAKMPTPSYLRALKKADKNVPPALAMAAASARSTLDALLRLQAALMESNPAIEQAYAENIDDSRVGTRKTRGAYAEASKLDLISKPANEAWKVTDAMFDRYTPFKEQSCDRWHRKAQVSSGKVGGGAGGSQEGNNNLMAFDQSLSQQVRSAMRLPDRLVRRSQPPTHLAPKRLGEPVRSYGDVKGGGEGVTYNETQNNKTDLHTSDDENNGRVPEVYEDADFYEQALKEFLDTHAGSSRIKSGLNPQIGQQKPAKRRKQVDRRASKGRKLRYHVQQPLVNFCAPIELEVPGWADKVFTRLFAKT